MALIGYTHLHPKLMDQRNQGHDPKVAINLGLDSAELIHYAPPHGKHVQVTVISAALNQLKSFRQRLLQTIQWLLGRREVHQVRLFQLLQQVPN